MRLSNTATVTLTNSDPNWHSCSLAACGEGPRGWIPQQRHSHGHTVTFLNTYLNPKISYFSRRQLLEKLRGATTARNHKKKEN